MALPSSGFVRAQGATEYLIVLAAVLVIGVITATLLGYFSGYSGGITETESHVYWQSVAKPVRVIEATTDTCSCDVCSSAGVYVLVVQNANNNQITLSDVLVDNVSKQALCLGRGTQDAGSITLKPGKQTEIVVVPNGPTACDPSQPSRNVEIDLKFSYNSHGLDLVQAGEKKLVLRCRKQGPDGTYED